MELQAQAEADSPTVGTKKAAQRPRAHGEELRGWLFVSPMLMGVFVQVLIPIVATLALSLADWNFVQGWDGIKSGRIIEVNKE